MTSDDNDDLTVDQCFLRGLDQFDRVVESLDDDDWDRPSPCAGWTATDVVGHLGIALRIGVAVLEGEQPVWPQVDRPADLVEGPPAAWWTEASAAARAALPGADLDRVVDTPMGPRTVAERLAFPALDLFVHAWDLGRTAGIDVIVPDDVIAFAHLHLDPIPEEMTRSAGVFGPEVQVPADAAPSDRFLAWTGRDPSWTPA